MKAVILAGGLGTRISEETELRPKPMIEIGAKPLLWHIMKIYAAQGIDEFVVCLGYRGYVIKEYFANYYLHMGDVTFDLRDNSMEVHNSGAEPWRGTLIDTGEGTPTGDRIERYEEKPKGDGGWVNGGFFVLSPEVGRYIEDDSTVWEREPLEQLARDGQLAAYKHEGFWQPMDTLRDKMVLEERWASGDAP